MSFSENEAEPKSDAPPRSGGAAAAAAPPRRVGRFDLGTWRGRLHAWSNMILIDHGFFRFIYLNLHRIDASAWRAAQPAPHHLKRVQRKGVKTIVNLRGGREFGSYALELEACARLGLVYHEIRLRSREAPSPETLRDVDALLRRIDYPVLFHCKSGADRAGLMTALYFILKAGLSAAEAKSALSLRYGHVRQGKTGVLDAFLDAYDAAQRAADDKGERLTLLEWADSPAYDAKALTQAFRTTPWADWLIDGVLRRE